MKKYQKILLAVFVCILVIVLIFLGTMFFYYPRYKSHKQEVKADAEVKNLRVMSCNVRCFTPSDRGKTNWYYRADLIRQNLEKVQPTVIGFQEVTPQQYTYLCDVLPDYDSVLTYRDKTPQPEGCPVFYRTDLYTLKDKGSFWLSETPEVMSKDWGAACYRICSYVILTDKASAQDFVVFNTHLDHVSDEARIKGIGVVLDKIQEFGGLPAVLMGDLNADESSETYKAATENFLDSKYVLENPPQGCTYQNYGKNLDDPCIDYILITKDAFTVQDFKIVTDTYDGVYPSDHFPIVADLQFATQN